MKTSQWAFVFGAVTRAAASPGWIDQLLSSADGTCGKDVGYTCYGSFFGNCCGADGFCGSDADVCGAGCQKDFGFCQETLTQPGHELSSGPSRDGPSVSDSLPSLYDHPISCPADNGALWYATNGDLYVIECGIDHHQGNLPHTGSYVPSIDACIELCSNTTNCVDAAWVRGSPQGACYLKSTVGGAYVKDNVYSGRLILKAPLADTDITSKTRAGTAAVSTVVSTSPTKPSAVASRTSSLKVSTKFPSASSKNPSTTLKPVAVSVSSKGYSSVNHSSRGTNSTSSAKSSLSKSTCASVAAPTGSTLKNCTPCKGQPGNDKFCGFDINTNSYKHTPITCNVVHYEFDITSTAFAPDGVKRMGLLVNGQMPGPTIRASWGDTVVVKVNNKLSNNGTSIHFHGIRQLNNNMNDGVVSVTQCPIAPGESFTYTWVAENYGTSWYHSHFGIQTYEGVFGPMIIDGPHSQSFDQDLGTFVMQDWTHVTVDSMYDLAQNATSIPGRTDGATYGGPQTMDTGLINGLNVFGDDGSLNQTGKRLELSFVPGRSYLLRIINTAIQSTFKFSIDGHTMTVISNDFVPIVPYDTQTLGVAIGQRYNVIVTANAKPGNYWMRADNQESCAHTVRNRDIKAIVRYVNGPSGTLPSSKGWNYTDSCADEPLASLVPVLALDAGDADITEGTFDVVVQSNNAHLYKWYISGTTFQSNYNDPPLLDIVNNMTVNDYSGNLQLSLPDAGKMVYVVIESPIPLPHPLHLHGHDFWILASGDGSYDSSVSLQLKNPPRRDTVSMPGAGYVVIAFETDNPGLWLFHCHIGWHTSMGLALTFMEMQSQITSSGAVNNSCALKNNCNSWNTYSTANSLTMFDSGV